MFFVSDVPNNGQNVLDIMVTKPNRERQKLMREQNILKQVAAHTWAGRASGRAHGQRAGHLLFFFLVYICVLFIFGCFGSLLLCLGCLWLLLGVAPLGAEHGLQGVRVAANVAPGV